MAMEVGVGSMEVEVEAMEVGVGSGFGEGGERFKEGLGWGRWEDRAGLFEGDMFLIIETI